MRRAIVLFLLLCGLALDAREASSASCPKLRVASKPFTESYILSEILAQLIADTGETTVERAELAGPTLVFDALKSGDVDLDVNYTGAIANLLLRDQKNPSLEELRVALRANGIVLGEPLGFNNTYAIAVRTETAKELGLKNVGDLGAHPELRGAFTPDFLNFEDGFYKLQERYGIHLDSVKPMQHALAYRALTNHEIDLTDAYTTDGSLAQFQLTLLADDREFFPKYYGVITARASLPDQCPKTWAALRRLEGIISDERMTRLNAKIENREASIAEVARGFLGEQHLLSDQPRTDAAASSSTSPLDTGLWVATWEHLSLVLISLFFSCVIGVPLGILAFRNRRLGHAVIAAAGLLQTIPSLALLCFLIPFLGIGALPTIFSLFLYGLLPVVQNTTSGLLSLSPDLIETAKILGLSRTQRLRLIELPLASINIVAGIKTSAIINVATATIAALIGAGGYGRYIVSGLAMNDMTVILKGSIPTALMAIAFHFVFELLSYVLRPA